MAGPSWLVDSRRIATKIKRASETCDLKRVEWKSNPTRACPKCSHIIDNSDVSYEWPGLPRGVKFDPSDQEIIWHLLSKVGIGNVKPHPFIEEFIPTVDEDDGICYAHPENLPGVKQDGTVSHFFHRAVKAYNTGTRKRRKIHGDHMGDVRWHKTGRTKPVNLDGEHRGCKKILVLYRSTAKGGKAEKTNWVMHQYHLGTGEDEKDGEYVVSKVFYQQQTKAGDKVEDLPVDATEATVTKLDPVTPTSVIRGPRTDNKHSDVDHGQEPALCSTKSVQSPVSRSPEDRDECGVVTDSNNHTTEEQEGHMVEDHVNQTVEDSKWLEGESQNLLDSQQLIAGESQNLLDSQQLIALCAEVFGSQSLNKDGDSEERKTRSRPSDYTPTGSESFKKECMNLGPFDSPNGDEQRNYAHAGSEDQEDLLECPSMSQFDPNIDLDTIRLSQLFTSQDSFQDFGA